MQMSMDFRRVTQADVARAAGVTGSAVSLALRNHPRIAVETRKRIVKIAAELGYIPDPMLSALTARRWADGPTSFQGTLAWLVRTTADFDWRTACPEFFKGANAGATQLGFRLEAFEVGNNKASAHRLGRTLRARNIPGVVVCPRPQPESELDFPWEDFSAVAIGTTLQRPELHTVEAARFRATARVMQQLRARGYRRIGLILGVRHNQRTAHDYLGGYLGEQQVTGCPPLVWLMDSKWDPAREIRSWLAEIKPDAILSGDWMLEALERVGVRVPDQLGVAWPGLVDPRGKLAGVVENLELIGRTAVELLVGQIHRRERGVPESPHRVSIDGYWHEGLSLRATTPPVSKV
jgi:DNA-binding LacI/PurR family transcriptional regulator